MSNGWKYVGEGARVSFAVPTRDISAEEFARFTPLDQRHVEQSDLYERMTAAETRKAEKAADAEVKQEGGDS